MLSRVHAAPVALCTHICTLVLWAGRLVALSIGYADGTEDEEVYSLVFDNEATLGEDTGARGALVGLAGAGGGAQ